MKMLFIRIEYLMFTYSTSFVIVFILQFTFLQTGNEETLNDL